MLARLWGISVICTLLINHDLEVVSVDPEEDCSTSKSTSISTRAPIVISTTTETTETTEESDTTTEKSTATTSESTITTEESPTTTEKSTATTEKGTTITSDSTTTAADEEDDEDQDEDKNDDEHEDKVSTTTTKSSLKTATTTELIVDSDHSELDLNENNGPNLRTFANWAQESWNGENTFKVDLFTPDGSSLIGNLTLGSPPTTIRVAFDTTTYTTWVTGYHCIYTNGVTCYTQVHKYDPTLSYTATFLNRTMALDYGNAMAKGEFVQELMVLGTQMSSSFPMFFNVGVANRLDTFFRDVLLDGVVGLAFPPANNTGFIESLLHSQIFEKPIFSIWLNSRRNLTSDLVAGTIVFGRSDKKHCGKVIGSARVMARPLWGFKLHNITLNGYLIRRGINAVLDMGSSHIFVPRVDLIKIQKVLKTNNTMRLPCRKYMKMVLRGNQTKLVMKNTNLMTFLEKKKKRKYCTLDIREGAEDQDVWILGAVFFRQFCVIHNFLKGIIGFTEHLD